MLLVVVGTGDCTNRKGGFGVPRLRFFIILAKVVDFLILLQVSVSEEGKKNVFILMFFLNFLFGLIAAGRELKF